MASEKRNVNHFKTTKARFASEKQVSGSNPETSTQFRHQERSKGALDVQNRFEHLENELLLEDGYNLAQTGRKEVKLLTKVAKDSFRTPNQENHLVDSDEDGEPEQQINTSKIKFSQIPVSVFCNFPCGNGQKLQNSKNDICSLHFSTLDALEHHLQAVHNIIFRKLDQNLFFLQEYLDEYVKIFEERRDKATTEGLVFDLHQSTNDPAEIQGNDGKISTNNFNTIDPSIDESDSRLRTRIRRDKLEMVLKHQIIERETEYNIPRRCLFCKEEVRNRHDLFAHMFRIHGFNIGLLDNLVYTTRFLDILEEKLFNLQCLYCEKHFTSNMTLRKHMRKKKHFKISAENRIYDQFYLINYSEQGTGCKVLETAICESEGDNGAENEWEDWVDDTELQCYSLFDSKALSSIDSCIEYMKSEYSFDLLGFLKEIDADFYKTVSFVNYTRSKTADKSCFNCGEIFEKDKQLQNHLKLSRHCTTTPSSNLISTMSTIEHLAPFLENDCLFGISMAFDSENEQHH